MSVIVLRRTFFLTMIDANVCHFFTIVFGRVMVGLTNRFLSLIYFCLNVDSLRIGICSLKVNLK